MMIHIHFFINLYSFAPCCNCALRQQEFYLMSLLSCEFLNLSLRKKKGCQAPCEIFTWCLTPSLPLNKILSLQGEYIKNEIINLLNKLLKMCAAREEKIMKIHIRRKSIFIQLI